MPQAFYATNIKQPSTQGFAKYDKMYFLQNYHIACSIQNCYVCMQN